MGGDMPTNKGLLTGIAVSLVLAGLSAVPKPEGASAHEGATGVVKLRMKAMSKLEKRLRPVRDMAKGKRKFDAEILRERALHTIDVAGKIPSLFPKGSHRPPTEAKPEVWKDWPGFLQKADDLEAAARRLLRADARTLPTAYADVMKACRGCHENYRVEKE